MDDRGPDVDESRGEWVRLATVYQDVFIPVADALRRQDVDHQLEIFNELRNAVAHLAWTTLPGADRPHQIRSAC